jgi:hypothetical protein
MSRLGSFAPRIVAGLVRIALGLVLAGLGLCPSRAARANGAFPESFQLLLPEDRPGEIILATNFGLILSDDAGATWTWTCERMPETDQGYLYAVGAPPTDRLFAISPGAGLALSNDDSCTWSRAAGSLTPITASDVFPDQTKDSMTVYAVAAPASGAAPSSIYASADGGLTFGAALFTAPKNGIIQGVESARSDPKTIYVAMYIDLVVDGGTMLLPQIVRSTDGGMTWTTTDVTASLGMNFFYIVAVDPTDPMTLTVRVIEEGLNTLAISHDGGQTFTKALSFAGGVFTAYARLGSGTILVGGYVIATAHGFRSTDGGKSFVDWTVPSNPHIRALAERDGKLYAAAKNYTDGWAVGVSTDEGLTFQPLMKYDDVKSIRACAFAACADNCDTQAGNGVWRPAVCANPDGGVLPPPPKKSGCGCHVGSPSESLAVLVAVSLAVSGALTLRRRRRRGPGALDTPGPPV